MSKNRDRVWVLNITENELSPVRISTNNRALLTGVSIKLGVLLYLLLAIALHWLNNEYIYVLGLQ